MNKQIIFPNLTIDYEKLSYFYYTNLHLLFGTDSQEIEMKFKNAKEIYNLLSKELEELEFSGHSFKIDFREYFKLTQEEKMLDKEEQSLREKIASTRKSKKYYEEELEKYREENNVLNKEIQKIKAEKRAKEAEFGLTIAYTKEGALSVMNGE